MRGGKPGHYGSELVAERWSMAGDDVSLPAKALNSGRDVPSGISSDLAFLDVFSHIMLKFK